MKKRKTDGWIVVWSDGVIYKSDNDDQWWLGGGGSSVYVPLFKDRNKAYNFVRKIRRDLRNKKELYALRDISEDIRVKRVKRWFNGKKYTKCRVKSDTFD